jgi:hypothetical protein
MDCHGDIVVPVPGKDGPELCCEAIRFQDDARDKIVLYDRSRMHIYRPAGSIPKGRKTYLPEKAPLCNWSNFMAHYSYPRWD